VKPVTNTRKQLLASLLVGSAILSSGCSTGGFSIASLNPFARPEASPVDPAPTPPGMTETFASMTDSARKGMTSIGASARDAVGKTTGAMASVFRRPAEETVPAVESDPLSLANKPESVGADVYVANGQLWESSGDLTKAMESYTKALESEPNSTVALASIARLNYRQGQYQQANEYFSRAIKQSPNDAELLNDIGLTRSKLNDTAGAVAAFQQALSLAPKTSRYANNLATVQFESGNPAAAYQVLAANNKPAVAHFNMAYLYFKAGQMDQAKQHLGGALQFESQAGEDTIVKRAVDRSREMLAQIDASRAPIAQAAPQATIAGGQFFDGPQTAPVRQTAQSEKATPVPTGKSAPTPAPAAQSIRPPAVQAPATPAPTAPTASQPATTRWQTNTYTRPQSVARPVRPTMAAPENKSTTTPEVGNPEVGNPEVGNTEVGNTEADSSASEQPKLPFALPSGFSPEG